MNDCEKQELKRRLELVSDRLSFTEADHVYSLDSMILPSVTQILKPISSLIYGGINDSIMQMAQERGTTVHNAIEYYEQYGYEMDKEHEYYPYFQAYLNYRKDYPQSKPALSEFALFHSKYLYAGRADILTEDDCLIDVKTSAEIYLGYTKTQLIGYAEALQDCCGYTPKHGAILHLKPDGTYFPHKFTIQELKTYWAAFLSCMKIRNVANER